MCGIVGIFDYQHQRPINRALLQRMNDSQAHRGPDGSGLYLEAGIGLGHKRLSIIDVASGQQPMRSRDGSCVISFNGEIYNHAAIRQHLQAQGHVFSSHCDTEVIVHAWQAWGEACLERLRGMFAFALWDSRQQTLFLARDRLGIKPLFYAPLADGQVLFGSELKALTQHPQLPCVLDPTAIEEFFGFGYIPDPKTIYQGVYKLPPGHCLTLRRGSRVPAPRQYWDVTFQPNHALQESAAMEELLARLQDSVALHRQAEVPLGAFLSGGVDSSAVVALLAGLSEQPVTTCSIAFGEPRFNESAYAAEMATRYHTQHWVQAVAANDVSALDRLATLYDEPYADSSALPTYHLCQLARQHVTVALSGDGGDETLAGYRRYRWHGYEQGLRNALPDALRMPLFSGLGRLYPKLDWAPKPLRAKSTLQSLGRDALGGYFHSVSVIPDGMRAQLFSGDLRQQLHGYQAVEVFRRYQQRLPREPLSQVQYLDCKTYLPGDILTKVDRASMAHGLEVRVPLLDHPLVEWLATLPPSLKLRGQEGKYLFKKALEPSVPTSILYRPKMGFGVPLCQWFRGPLQAQLQETVLGERLRNSGYFNAKSLQRLVKQHQCGSHDHSAALWALMQFESFLRHCRQV